MTRFLALLLACVCSGCAVPLATPIGDHPPFDVLRAKTLTTSKVAWVLKNTKDKDGQPDLVLWHLITAPDISSATSSYTSSTVLFSLPAGTRLRLTSVQHIHYPPHLFAYAEVRPYNAFEATILSGPHAGVKVWAPWGETPAEVPGFLVVSR